jgi:uracil-DNA glycosylase family 4
MQSLYNLNKKIIQCKKCPRLALYIQKIAKDKVKRFNDQKYWGKPVPSFGDPNAELLLIGLAPAAHGGNRTGRMFTGDSSGDWVAKILYEKGFATKPTSERLGDGYNLINTYITATIRCAPPQNKPFIQEIDNCSVYLTKELSLLKKIKVIICLGRIAFDSCCKILNIKNRKFEHGKVLQHEKFNIISTYHPSRQNTQTGRLAWQQWSDIFSMAQNILVENR